ncbi:aminotransferase class I/II-fold pyridoxal phosphate-dependent enzyme [Actinomadura fulvescens]|uniref:cysteine-S-conjugate beta-lyase n=1 Tax=Actinomadura fulvescens TaxID=46160 RepID=A0ABN3QB51_9ACTN
MKWAKARPGVLPAWIADMDFPAAAPIRETLERQATGVLGYPTWIEEPETHPLRAAFAERMRSLYGLTFDPAHVRVYTELIQSLQIVLHVATRPGDAVAMHTPSYPPFLRTLTDMKRRLVPIPMADDGTGWTFDAERLADDVARTGCRALVLVNPHNPTGRVLTHEELAAIAEIAERHDLLVVSDEIHAELTYAPHRHVPFATLSPDRTVTLSSASKSFNLAGLRCSVAHIGDARVRRALDAQPPALFGEVSFLSVLATLAAWERGDAWLSETRHILTRNRRLVADGLPSGIRHHVPEATYLAWLDCRKLGLGPDPSRFFLDHADVLLSQGPTFGPGGEGFTRLNFATSAPVLEEILTRVRTAVEHRTGT